MSDGADSGSTVQDIVVALRATARRRRGGDMPATEERRSDPGRSADRSCVQRVESLHQAWRGENVADAGIAELRDGEIERLLSENRRLNDRVVFLLKVIEHDQQTIANERAAATILADEQETMAREARAALEAEWRPILVTLIRMLDRREHDQPSERGGRGYFGDAKTDSRAGGRAGRGEVDEHGYYPGWILDLIRGADRLDHSPTAQAHPMRDPSSSSSDEREGSFFVRFFTRITHFR